MVIAGALAGIAGGLMSVVYAVHPHLGSEVILPALIVVVVGGMGSVEGVVIAAIIFGFVTSFVTVLVDAFVARMVVVTIMAMVLALRPQGLMGRVIA